MRSFIAFELFEPPKLDIAYLKTSKSKEYNNCFVKIIVANKTNATIFDKFIDRLYKEITTHEINIIEDYSEIKESIKQDLLAEAGEDTMTFLNKYIEQLNVSVDKEKLKKLLKVLYSEANDSI